MRESTTVPHHTQKRVRPQRSWHVVICETGWEGDGNEQSSVEAEATKSGRGLLKRADGVCLLLCGNVHNQLGVLSGALTRCTALALGCLPECLLPVGSQLG
jgi:hypothetical protein